MFALARQCGKMPLCALYNPDRLHRHITTGIQHCFQEVFVCVCRGCGHRLSTAMLNQIQKWGICWQKKEQWTMTTYWAGLWLPWLPFPVEECYWAADLEIKVAVPCMDLVWHGSGGRHNCWWLHMWPGTCVTTRWPRMLHPFCSASSMKVYSCGSAMASSSNILYRSKKKKNVLLYYCLVFNYSGLNSPQTDGIIGNYHIHQGSVLLSCEKSSPASNRWPPLSSAKMKWPLLTCTDLPSWKYGQLMPACNGLGSVALAVQLLS